MVNAISERNLPVPNFAYHLPKAWTRFDHVNGKQQFVNRLSPLSKLYEKNNQWSGYEIFRVKRRNARGELKLSVNASLPLRQVYLYTLIYRERNTEGKSRQAQLNYSRKV